MEGVVVWALEDRLFNLKCIVLVLFLSAKNDKEELAPLPDILFSQNAFNWNC